MDPHHKNWAESRGRQRGLKVLSSLVPLLGGQRGTCTTITCRMGTSSSWGMDEVMCGFLSVWSSECSVPLIREKMAECASRSVLISSCHVLAAGLSLLEMFSAMKISSKRLWSVIHESLATMLLVLQ